MAGSLPELRCPQPAVLGAELFFCSFEQEHCIDQWPPCCTTPEGTLVFSLCFYVWFSRSCMFCLDSEQDVYIQLCCSVWGCLLVKLTF